MKRVELLSEKAMTVLRKISFKNWCVPALSFLLTLSACNNHSFFANRSPSSVLEIGNAPASNGGSFVLYAVTPDPLSPGTVFDMIGQNQEFEVYCRGTLGTCSCEYSYIQPGIGAQVVSSASTYQESDMIRCPNSVPSGVTSFDVKVKVIPSATGGTEYESNSLTYNLTSTAGSNLNSAIYMDLTDERNFNPVQRFQCRKREWIPNPLDQSILDPFQSMDPNVIYPFNYYTTNVSESLLRLQQGSTQSGGANQTQDQSWDCTLSATSDGSMHWWANPYVFSQATCTDTFCGSDAELIYPNTSLSSGKIPVSAGSTASGKYRSSFSLAKRAYGVFQIPVVAAIAPKDYVSAIYSTSAAPLGWAAKPIPNVSGSSSCPNITLPSNAHWVKLWNFRADNISAPKRVSTSKSSNRAAIACQPEDGFDSCRRWPQSNGQIGNASAFNNPLKAALPITSLSSRVGFWIDGSDVGVSSCNKIDAFPVPAATNSADETWTPSPYKFNGQTAGSGGVTKDQMASFPWNLYVGAGGMSVCSISPSLEEWLNSTGSCTSSTSTVWPNPPVTTYTYNPAIASGTPSDPANDLTSVPLSTDPFIDQIFVVTDPDVNDISMKNGASAVSQYIPVTYRSRSACDSVTRAGCPAQGYEGPPIEWHNVVTDVDQPTVSGPAVYPLCVVQFTD